MAVDSLILAEPVLRESCHHVEVVDGVTERLIKQMGETLEFDPAPPRETAPGMVTRWEISPAIKLSRLDLERSPHEQDLGEVDWQAVESEPSGLVNVARYRS